MKTTKQTKKQAQGAKTKQTLYECAKLLFQQYDFESVSVEDITKAAGITKGAFYVHFSSKDDLIGSLIKEYTDNSDIVYQSILDTLAPDLSTAEVIEKLTKHIALTIETNIGVENLCKVYQMTLTKTLQTNPILQYDRSLYGILKRIIADGLEKGEINPVYDADSLTRFLITAIRGICFEWCVRYPDYNLSDQISQHLHAFLHGITRQ